MVVNQISGNSPITTEIRDTVKSRYLLFTCKKKLIYKKCVFRLTSTNFKSEGLARAHQLSLFKKKKIKLKFCIIVEAVTRYASSFK